MERNGKEWKGIRNRKECNAMQWKGMEVKKPFENLLGQYCRDQGNQKFDKITTNKCSGPSSKGIVGAGSCMLAEFFTFFRLLCKL